jgi:hypothetical protein
VKFCETQNAKFSGCKWLNSEWQGELLQNEETLCENVGHATQPIENLWDLLDSGRMTEITSELGAGKMEARAFSQIEWKHSVLYWQIIPKYEWTNRRYATAQQMNCSWTNDTLLTESDHMVSWNPFSSCKDCKYCCPLLAWWLFMKWTVFEGIWNGKIVSQTNLETQRLMLSVLQRRQGLRKYCYTQSTVVRHFTLISDDRQRGCGSRMWKGRNLLCPDNRR